MEGKLTDYRYDLTVTMTPQERQGIVQTLRVGIEVMRRTVLTDQSSKEIKAANDLREILEAGRV